MARFLSLGLTFSGLIFFALVVWNFLAPVDPPGVFIDTPEREFSGLQAENSTHIRFSIHNPTRHSAQLIGLASYC